MFRGVSYLSIDSKSRLAMPVKYRDVLNELSNGQVILTIDPTDKCLLIYPMNVWDSVEISLLSSPTMNRLVRNRQRLILGYASELTLDRQGRFLLPSPLREYAGLQKQAVLVGQGNKFELWDTATWESACKAWLQEVQEANSSNDILTQVSL